MMASVLTHKKKNGLSHTIQYYLPNGKREYIHFGQKYKLRQVQGYKEVIESLLEAKQTNRPLSRREQQLLEDLSSEVKKKMAAKNLTSSFEYLNNGELWNRHIREKDLNPRIMTSTIRTYYTAKNRFLSFFDSRVLPDEITPLNALEFREWLQDQGFAEATIANTITRTRTVFTWGIKRGYVSRNYFNEVERGSFVNKSREYYITREEFGRILNVCISPEFRLFLVLCRIGGLRFTETQMIRWYDVDWERGRLRVPSPKTERYEGKGSRLIPLYPELREALEAFYRPRLPQQSDYILNAYHDVSNQSMSKEFKKMLIWADITPWPRIFHNLRASRSNELFSEWPEHVASAWMGQSKRVAVDHYLHATEEQFRQATEKKIDVVKI